ncbi:unnamed protein product [Sympodiomycopsis kandeliae]
MFEIAIRGPARPVPPLHHTRAPSLEDLADEQLWSGCAPLAAALVIADPPGLCLNPNKAASNPDRVRFLFILASGRHCSKRTRKSQDVQTDLRSTTSLIKFRPSLTAEAPKQSPTNAEEA